MSADTALTKFQFTHPGRGATSQQLIVFTRWHVSIHAPREGCDAHYLPYYTARRCFNSRTPGGVRPTGDAYTTRYDEVSIHAPREGCDSPSTMLQPLTCCFNSRTPGGVRLHWIGLLRCYGSVSIHAPREGCDYTHLTDSLVKKKFQFTHPGRGATQERRGISIS